MKWLQEVGSFVARMKDRMPELLLNYRNDVWRRPGRPSKTLLGVAETGLLKPISWRLLLLLLSSSLVTGLSFLVLLLNQRWSPLLRLQASHCSTFRIMCDVPSILLLLLLLLLLCSRRFRSACRLSVCVRYVTNLCQSSVSHNIW
jgi:hypothetical protein